MRHRHAWRRSVQAAVATFLLAVSVANGAGAQSLSQNATPSARLITAAVVDHVRGFATAPIVLEALSAAPARSSQDDIDRLDAQWRAERDAQDQPLITSVLSNPLSTYLLRIQAGAGGLFTEIFVMDMSGLNVGQSAITSDYWQGDEAKFQKTAEVSPTAVFIDEPEFHEASATWRAQINMAIPGADGTAVGAITAEVNLTELQRRARAGISF